MEIMNEPLVWEEVPTVPVQREEGGAIVPRYPALKTYRAKLDGKGWLVFTMLNGSHASGLVFLPDENNMWGK